MILGAFLFLILPISLVLFLRDFVDELRNPSPIREQGDSGGSTFASFDGGGGDGGCDAGAGGCH